MLMSFPCGTQMITCYRLVTPDFLLRHFTVTVREEIRFHFHRVHSEEPKPSCNVVSNKAFARDPLQDWEVGAVHPRAGTSNLVCVWRNKQLSETAGPPSMLLTRTPFLVVCLIAGLQRFSLHVVIFRKTFRTVNGEVGM